MGDYDVKMQFAVEADRSAIARRFTSTDAIASWWSDGVEGAAASPGDKFHVSFPDAPAPFELEVSRVDDDAVEWFIADQPEWWAGTTVRLEAGEDPTGGGSLLLFTHGGFDSDSPVIPIVTPVWAQVMLRLKEVIESNADNPFFVTIR